LAPYFSRMARAQMRRAARYLAISSKKSLWALKKKLSRAGELVHVQPARDGCLDVGEAVGQGEGQLLRCRAAGLADVVAADADGVPLRQLVRAELHRVGHQAHGGLGREEELLLRDVLLEDVVLQGAAQLLAAVALLLGRGDVHGPDDGRGRVDGHRCGDIAQGDLVEEDLHVGQRADRHAALAELAQRLGRVAVVAVERGHVEGHAQAGLSLAEQVAEAGVGLLGRAEAREHAHGPQLASVQRGMDAPRVWVLAGEADVSQIVGVRDVGWRVQPLHRRGGGGDEAFLALREAVQGLLERGGFPALGFVFDTGHFVEVEHTSLSTAMSTGKLALFVRVRITLH
jgi:hypothetical protein